MRRLVGSIPGPLAPLRVQKQWVPHVVPAKSHPGAATALASGGGEDGWMAQPPGAADSECGFRESTPDAPPASGPCARIRHTRAPDSARCTPRSNGDGEFEARPPSRPQLKGNGRGRLRFPAIDDRQAQRAGKRLVARVLEAYRDLKRDSGTRQLDEAARAVGAAGRPIAPDRERPAVSVGRL